MIIDYLDRSGPEDFIADICIIGEIVTPVRVVCDWG